MSDRVALLEALETASPALATNDLVPVRKRFCFTGHAVVACNAEIGISVPVQTTFVGTVPGTLTIELLKGLKTTDVDIVAGSDGVTILAGASRITLPARPDEVPFEFQMPTYPLDGDDLFSPSLLPAIELCLRSVAEYSPMSDQLGVTVMAYNTTIELFSTDKATLSYCKLVGSSHDVPHVILPRVFCEHMLRLAKDATRLRLSIQADHALFAADDTLLFGTLLRPSGQVDFRRIIDHHLPDNYEHAMVGVPQRLGLILGRASLIADIQGHDIASRVQCRGSRMRFVTRSERGEVDDMLNVPEHPDVSARFLAALLRDGLSDFDTFLITAECAIFRKGERLRFVSTTLERD